MAKIKKSFDRELMYKKIMPTDFKIESKQVAEVEEVLSNAKDVEENQIKLPKVVG